FEAHSPPSLAFRPPRFPRVSRFPAPVRAFRPRPLFAPGPRSRFFRPRLLSARAPLFVLPPLLPFGPRSLTFAPELAHFPPPPLPSARARSPALRAPVRAFRPALARCPPRSLSARARSLSGRAPFPPRPLFALPPALAPPESRRRPSTPRPG